MRLATEQAGSGPPIVLVHGLTATRRYVVHGSRLLERSGFTVVSYDARGHGESDPAADRSAYEYRDLISDLERILDQQQLERPLLVGASMGAATALAYALAHPERVAGLVQVTPAHLGLPVSDPERLEYWDRLANGLESDGVEGFMRAIGEPAIDERFRGLVMQAIRQRIERHQHPQAVADALRVVPRSQAFEGPELLGALEPPTLIVGSRDETDPDHPLEVAERYSELIPDARLILEEPGQSPIAWRGAALSRAILEFVQPLLQNRASVRGHS
jgi:3-oxoadipate enol-lactonase